VAGAERAPNGRLLRLRATGPVTLGTLRLPPGTLLHFATRDFIDPRRDDVLSEAELSSPIPLLGSHTRTGARLRFDLDGTLVAVREAFDGQLLPPGLPVPNLPVEGRAVIGFDREGRVTGFTLAEDRVLGGHRVRAGAEFSLSSRLGRLPAAWRCWLAAPLPLPELTLQARDACTLSADLGRMLSVSPRADVELGEVRVRTGLGPVPLTPEGRVDLKACRKAGLLSRT
jgi:hypothetical protein